MPNYKKMDMCKKTHFSMYLLINLLIIYSCVDMKRSPTYLKLVTSVSYNFLEFEFK